MLMLMLLRLKGMITVKQEDELLMMSRLEGMITVKQDDDDD
jgi:hypothetical protein